MDNRRVGVYMGRDMGKEMNKLTQFFCAIVFILLFMGVPFLLAVIAFIVGIIIGRAM